MRVGTLANPYFLNLYIPTDGEMYNFFFFFFFLISGWARAHPGHTLDPPVNDEKYMSPKPVRHRSEKLWYTFT
jgi:hypothetical protein